MHAVAEVHETPVRVLPLGSGLGLCSTVQLVPSQDSVSVFQGPMEK
jgi:hypothetical protein